MSEALEVLIGPLLRQQGLKLVVAESCTGGLIGHRITNIAGSSDYYLGSITAYSYEAKERLLGIKHETLVTYGAVSRETVLEMAYGARCSLAGFFSMNNLVGIAVTGIAGPGGGLPNKPVGLVWIALNTPQGSWAWDFIWKGDRVNNKEQTAEKALALLYDFLNGKTPPDG